MLDSKAQGNRDFYVNYIEVENKISKQKIVNLSDLNNKEGLESIKYSSLLPFNPKGTLDISEQFKKDLMEGLYDGYKLDGGLVNNTLIEPLINRDLDKIILITMRHDYILPHNIKEKLSTEDIIIIRPNTIFTKNDTLRFEKEFCKKIYNEGYEIGKNIIL